jgi:riboflavin biosynthesis pyrimidine reductase
VSALDAGRGSATLAWKRAAPQPESDQLAAKAVRVSVATVRTDRIAMSDRLPISSSPEAAIIDRDDMHA